MLDIIAAQSRHLWRMGFFNVDRFMGYVAVVPDTDLVRGFAGFAVDHNERFGLYTLATYTGPDDPVSRTAIHRLGLRLFRHLDSWPRPVIAYRDGTVEGSKKWLKRLGFEKQDEDFEGVEVWEWRH